MILTVITPAHKSSADELKASARCLQNAEKKKHWLEMKTYIVATIVLLVCCLFELAMKRSSILPPVIKQSLKSQTLNTRRI